MCVCVCRRWAKDVARNVGVGASWAWYLDTKPERLGGVLVRGEGIRYPIIPYLGHVGVLEELACAPVVGRAVGRLALGEERRRVRAHAALSRGAPARAAALGVGCARERGPLQQQLERRGRRLLRPLDVAAHERERVAPRRLRLRQLSRQLAAQAGEPRLRLRLRGRPRFL